MVQRAVKKKLESLAKQYPVVTITGPRQSGKTTLCQTSFKNYAYFSLEDPELRAYAQEDPRGFLEQSKKMIIDEIQKVPELVSYIQGVVDKSKKNGHFILTGSHQFELSNIISQSLAGRTAIIKLLPFSLQELDTKLPISKLIYRGFYPRIISEQLNPTEALSFYTNTYLEKDLRELKVIKNLSQFESFLKLCASNIGQLLNKNRIANDIGVDGKTIDSWLSVLQASYIVYLLPPHFKNFRKRLAKSPKLYFYDVGLAAYLLGIKKASHVDSHPLKGALFENLVIMEKLKGCFNQVSTPAFYFFRDNTGNEIDLLEENGTKISSYEIKITKTLNPGIFKGLNFYQKLNPENNASYLIYGGNKIETRYGHQCLPISALSSTF